ncbi:hypothetical protein H4R99_008323 [Coemansia sp. RSA 1722]|nr:hypothetical protein LPJ57_002042 [Coemansia sp. RSA 486]KAJ2235811.1 hypothetical protein IWW45_002309 [Coemansia sp. RSA 485]KAJ2586888.1 hypothetical protein H4R99_008323 [Coemansia sp. RSA 1722]
MAISTVAEIADFEQILIKHTQVVAGFFVSWCAACKTMTPVYTQLAQENPGIKFVYVDIDNSLDLSHSCGITAMPTFKFYDNRNKTQHEVIGAKKAELVAEMAKFTKSATVTTAVIAAQTEKPLSAVVANS